MIADKTFIIPTVTNIQGAVRCIKSIYKYTDNFRIILIDNSDYDYDEETKAFFKSTVHLHIRPYYNLGFAKSCNTGIRLSDTDYVVLCNDDVEFINKAWWEGVMSEFRKDPKIVAVNPASIMDRNDAPRLPYKSEYSEDDYQALLNWKDTTGNYGNAELKNIVIDGICMWCTVIPRRAFGINGLFFEPQNPVRIGLFDEKFYPGGGEDYDWNIRAYRKGLRCIGTFKSWAWHDWGSTKDTIPSKALPQREGLRWNNIDEKWGKGINIFGQGGKSVSMPSDDMRITPL
jgi:GT2 family glycosyltransferase